MKRLDLSTFRKITLEDWGVEYLRIAIPGQTNYETVFAEALYLTDDGRFVVVTRPFKNLAESGAKNSIDITEVAT